MRTTNPPPYRRLTVISLALIFGGNCANAAAQSRDAIPSETARASVTPRQIAQFQAAEKTLKRHEIEPTVAAVRDFLRALSSNGTRRQELGKKIQELSDLSAAVREEATQALVAEPFVPRRLLLDVTRANDPETTWRARQVLDRAGVAHGRVLHSALAIAARELATRNATPIEREQAQRLVLDFVDDAPSPDMARLWLQWFKPTSNAALAADWTAAVARVDAMSIRAGRARLDGRRLVSTGTRGLVLEFDHAGNIVWRFPAAAWSAERLVNGRTLLALLEEQRIVQVDQTGERLWEFGPVAATRAKPLSNGHILAADYSGGRVLEINSERAVVWSHNMPDPCFDAERLPNGNTLIGCANLVREVTADGQTVHQWMIRGRLNGLSLTPDGHLLIANFGANEVLELDDDGQVVWKLSEPQPCDAWRLESGHTLVTTAQRSVEFDGDGRVVRQWTTAKYGTTR